MGNDWSLSFTRIYRDVVSDYSQIFALSPRKGLSRSCVNSRLAFVSMSRAYSKCDVCEIFKDRNIIMTQCCSDECKFRSNRCNMARMARWNIRIWNCAAVIKLFLIWAETCWGSRISVASKILSFPSFREILSEVTKSM